MKNPLSLVLRKVLVDTLKPGLQTILLKKNEMKAGIKLYHEKYKNAGVRKLYKAICKRFESVVSVKGEYLR